ncbi:DUF4348 domain-containing protein [Labilibacter marinus]|uniref:DUF4348 domain-containing protein n=1 Tax=Labilibacter marinus TaxID=1477105 RepID=UPI00082EFE34|nr:DUF4348 domain-containing protein [Labilibacter marinus]
MKAHILILGVILFFTLNGFRNSFSQHDKKFNRSPLTPIQDSTCMSFNNFLELFSSDSTFQLNHILFPLKFTSIDMEEDEFIDLIKKEDWKFLQLGNNSETKNRNTNSHQQSIELGVDKAKILIRGIDNGISIDFVFEKRNGNWILIEWNDYSI